MEWVAVVLGALLLGAIGAGVYLWSRLQERTRELGKARALWKLGVHEHQRTVAVQAADVSQEKVAQLDAQIDRLRREVVDIEEDASRMSPNEVREKLRGILTRTMLAFLVLASAGSAHAQEPVMVQLEHEGQSGTWFDDATTAHLMRLAAEAELYRRLVPLYEARRQNAEETVASLRLALTHGDRAIDAARQVAFDAEARAIEADNRAASPWPKVLWGTLGVVLGAAIGVLVFALVAGGG